MVSLRCKMAVKKVLRQLGLHFVIVDLGEVQIMETLTGFKLEELKEALFHIGLELMDDKRTVMIEKILVVIAEMVNYSGDDPLPNQSEYISKKLKVDYSTLSNLFSEMKGMTIQQYIITHKIERVKDLLLHGKMNLTAISYKLNYSSVAHLSAQFKKVTGISPSDFILLKNEKNMNDIPDVNVENNLS